MRTRPRLLADTTPLRESRQYRLLFLNEGLAFLGSQITVVAVPLQVYLLTHSSLAVGLVGLAQLGPLPACSRWRCGGCRRGRAAPAPEWPRSGRVCASCAAAGRSKAIS